MDDNRRAFCRFPTSPLAAFPTTSPRLPPQISTRRCWGTGGRWLLPAATFPIARLDSTCLRILRFLRMFFAGALFGAQKLPRKSAKTAISAQRNRAPALPCHPERGEGCQPRFPGMPRFGCLRPTCQRQGKEAEREVSSAPALCHSERSLPAAGRRGTCFFESALAPSCGRAPLSLFSFVPFLSASFASLRFDLAWRLLVGRGH